MDPMAFGTSWKSIVEDAGWGAAALLTVLALVALVVFAVKGRHRNSQARAARALLGARNETPVGSCASTASDLSSVTQIEPALAFSPKVPCVIRVTYPLFAVACFWLFVWADLSVAARVNADLEVAGSPHTWEWSGTMSSLTLLPAAKDAWDGDAKATAILLGLLNGLWPFCQTLVLLIVWFLPSDWLSQPARGTLLRLFAAFGKCGLSFPWLITLWAALCQLHWQSHQVSATFNMSLERGLFAFLLAAVLTNALGHSADHFHFLSATTRTAVPWTRSHAGCRVPLSSFSKSRHWPTVLCPLVAVATAASSVVTAFSVSVTGGSTSATDSKLSTFRREAQPEYIRSYSLLAFGLRLADANQEAGVYERLFQVVFLATSLVVPILLAGVLLIVWVVPLKPHAQNGLLRLGHALDAWVALDVFAVVVAICSLDFGRITRYAAHQGDMEDACHWIQRELSSSACVRADVNLEKGFIMLAAAAVALLLVPKVALRACRRAVTKRDQLNSRAWASSVLTSQGR